MGLLTFSINVTLDGCIDHDEMDFQRAAQAYLWGIPAVGIHEWALAHRNVFKAKNGQMLSYLSFAEKLGILTRTTPRRTSSR